MTAQPPVSIVAVVLAAFLSPVLMLAPPVARADEPRTVEEILARHVQALGGPKALAETSTLRMTGKTTLSQGIEGAFVVELKRPAQLRLQVALDQGATMVQAFDGQSAWHSTTMLTTSEPQKLPDDLGRLYAEQADIDGPLVNCKAKGHAVELVGRETWNGRDLCKLKLVRKDAAEGEFDHYFLDAETWLVAKVESARTVMGSAVRSEKRFRDYRRVGEILVAYSVESQELPNGEIQAIHFDRIERNIDLPDERFSFAAAQALATAARAVAAEASADDTPAGRVQNEPEARALYDQMMAAFRAPQSLYLEAKYQVQLGASGGMTSTYKAWLRKPNQFRLEALNMAGVLTGVLIGDGQDLWIHWPGGRPQFYTPGADPANASEPPRDRSYMTKPAPPLHHSIGHEVGLLGSGMAMNILDLSTFHGYTDSLHPLIDGVARHGVEKVGEETCDVLDLSFMDGQRTWRVWTSQRDHLPRRMMERVRVVSDIRAREEWSNIRIDEEIPDAQFVWRPPDGWIEWRMPQTEQALRPVGEMAPDFTAKLADGRTTRLSDHRGKMVWLVFWRAG